MFDQCCVDTHFSHTLLTYSSALVWVKGSHSIKFGGEQRHVLQQFLAAGQSDRSVQLRTGRHQSAAGQRRRHARAIAFASLLLGYGDNTTGPLNIKPPVANKSKETGVLRSGRLESEFEADVESRLRYEWSTPYTERYNRSTFSDFNAQHRHDSARPGALNGTTIFATPDHRTVPSIATTSRLGWEWPIAGIRRP